MYNNAIIPKLISEEIYKSDGNARDDSQPKRWRSFVVQSKSYHLDYLFRN